MSSETPSNTSFDPTPFITGNGLSRRASVFSLSRISFSAQLSRLTTLALPLSSEFSERIKRMETSTEVSNAISVSAKQILRWIDTAKTVLKGLDAEDDVEWAAQGKKSLVEVDVAVGKFSNLMTVYVSAIDELQERDDAPSVGADIFKDVVETMEIILDGWNEVQELLRGVKGQVETAMEWNELWTTILQDIQAEIEACQTIVFEIEERRHRSLVVENGASSGMDIDTLATIVEDSPQKVNGQPPSEEDASLLRLFARMQPLRASLDFLPMRLASFQSRAESVFPSACEDLESRRKLLEKKWQKLNGDAEEMKRELGEDKWVAIFRNAGKQATQMIDSVERSLKKLKDTVNHFKDGHDLSTDSGIHKKVEAYEAKRVHYGPAIQRVLAIIDKGVSDRLTVNGEILRLHAAMHKRWRHMEQEMSITDEVLHELNLHISQQALRDSVSTIVSMDARSPNSMIHTPGSSPASSIVLSSPANTAKSNATVQRRSESAAGQYAKVSRGALGPSSATSNTPRAKLPPVRTSSNTFGNIFSPTSSRGASPSPNSQRVSVYHIPSPGNSGRPNATSARSTSSLDNRPRWNISVNTNDLDTGHHFKPLSLTTPSEHRKTPHSNTLSTPGTKTRIPIPSPLRYGPTPTPGQSPSLNPIMSSPTYKYSQNTGSKRASIYGASGFIKSPMTSPRSVSGTSSQGGLEIPMRPELRSRQSIPNLAGMYNSSGRKPSVSSYQGDDQISNATTSAVKYARPASAMASARRTVMQPRPRSPSAQSASGALNGIPGGDSGSSTASGRVSRAKRMSMPPKPLMQQAQDNKPKWR
ncbi:karyogamy protein [Terfezia claveryi]|nr:karyogamy protein [Terfezia claveryi]